MSQRRPEGERRSLLDRSVAWILSTLALMLLGLAGWIRLRFGAVTFDQVVSNLPVLDAATVDESMPGAAEFFDATLKFSVRSPDTVSFISETPWENLHLMPASGLLDELHGKLESRHKIYKLRDALVELEGEYDSIWIDTPPALNFYTRSALIAAQGCLIPFDCDDFSRRALYGLLESIKEIQADHNPDLVIEGIVVNQFQPRASLPQRTVQELIDEGLPVLEPYLSASVKIKESHEMSCPMIHLDANHKLTQQFVALYESLG